MKKLIYFVAALIIIVTSCKKDPDPVPDPTPVGPRLIFKFKFDSTQVRLDNLGNPVTIPIGNEAQSPKFNSMAAHYIELAPGDLTPLGNGEVIYRATENTLGWTNAVEFDDLNLVGEGEEAFSIPISQVASGSYKWIRLSVAYQNADIKFKSNSYVGWGTVASFLSFNTWINDFTIKTQSITVNDDKLQGYWGFEANIPFFGYYTLTGQAPAGATTVVNPLQATSPIPAGSCVITARFMDASGNPLNLSITGNETEDIMVTVSISTNKSFEWIENSGDQLYEPAAGDTLVDMGVRGLIPIIGN
jgi:hypothetical protein